MCYKGKDKFYCCHQISYKFKISKYVLQGIISFHDKKNVHTLSLKMFKIFIFCLFVDLNISLTFTFKTQFVSKKYVSFIHPLYIEVPYQARKMRGHAYVYYLPLFLWFSVAFWNCSDSVVFLELFWQCAIFRTVLTEWYFWNCSDCGIFRTVLTVWYF